MTFRNLSDDLDIKNFFGKRRLDEALRWYRQGKKSDCIESLSKLATEFPDNPDVRACLGCLLFGSDRYDEAVTHLQKVIALKPKSEWVSISLFHSLWSLGKEKEAHAEIRRFIRAYGKATEEYKLILAEMEAEMFSPSRQKQILEGVCGKAIVQVERHLKTVPPNSTTRTEDCDGTFFFSFDEGLRLFVDLVPEWDTLVVSEDVVRSRKLKGHHLVDRSESNFWRDKIGLVVLSVSIVRIDDLESGLKFTLEDKKPFYIYHYNGKLIAADRLLWNPSKANVRFQQL